MASVKKVFLIVAFLFFLAGVSVEVGATSIQRTTYRENYHRLTASVLHKKQATDLPAISQIWHLSCKVRDQRTLSDKVDIDWLAGGPLYNRNIQAKKRQSSFHLPFLRQLLFPNHNFW
jgi:hypothetical protein